MTAAADHPKDEGGWDGNADRGKEKPVTLEAADASTWVRRGDSWVCSVHAESILGDPFGRDRSSS